MCYPENEMSFLGGILNQVGSDCTLGGSVDNGKKRVNKKVVDFDFMFPEGEVYSYKQSPSEVFEYLEDIYDDDEPAPLAVFKPDVEEVDWIQKRYRDRLVDELTYEVMYASDPDEDNFISIPFPEELKTKIRNELKVNVGEYLLESSRSTRDYFKYWFAWKQAETTLHELMPPRAVGPGRFGCSGIMAALAVAFIISGFGSDTLAGSLIIAFFLFLGAYAWLRSGENSRKRAEENYLANFHIAEKAVKKARKKLDGFLERNPWYSSAINEVVSKSDGFANDLINQLEELFTQKRIANTFIDATETAFVREKELETKISLEEKPPRMTSFTPNEYEIYCAGWVKALGGLDVRVTQQSSDGGIDIVSENEVAQVKLHGSSVSVQPIRELFGVAKSMNKTALFFTSKGYTQSSITFAENNGIYLFIADPLNDSLTGATAESKLILRGGLPLNTSSPENDQ